MALKLLFKSIAGLGTQDQVAFLAYESHVMLNNLESILLGAFKSGVEICMGYVFLLVILALAFNYEVNKGQFKDQILGVFTYFSPVLKLKRAYEE